ncbi:MAG: tetratricopeptide repeat protein, partial [Xanthomonadales bacterium]|nr:tetratricopeptide repeat protein [Xanthomonadales bacterium]
MTQADSATAASPDSVLREGKLQLQQGQLQAASDTLQQLLSEYPRHQEGLYYFAVCLRQGGNHRAAADILEQLQQAHPRYGRAYQEEGHNLKAIAQHPAAAEAFEKAVALNPALLGSWRALQA